MLNSNRDSTVHSTTTKGIELWIELLVVLSYSPEDTRAYITASPK